MCMFLFTRDSVWAGWSCIESSGLDRIQSTVRKCRYVFHLQLFLWTSTLIQSIENPLLPSRMMSLFLFPLTQYLALAANGICCTPIAHSLDHTSDVGFLWQVRSRNRPTCHYKWRSFPLHRSSRPQHQSRPGRGCCKTVPATSSAASLVKFEWSTSAFLTACLTASRSPDICCLAWSGSDYQT